MGSPAAISIGDLTLRWHGSARVLKVMPFEIASGRKVLLTGPSGAGKSTLLSLLSGILVPSSGSVSVNGTDLTALSRHKRDLFRGNHVGIIFQLFNLLTYASPLDNILLPLTFAPQRRARVVDPRGEALRLTRSMRLDDQLILGTKAQHLSIGQQQRVAAARALLGSPALIMADEPTSALDPNNRDDFLDVLFDQVEEAGSTLLMVSHDAAVTKRFDTVINIEDQVAFSEERAR